MTFLLCLWWIEQRLVGVTVDDVIDILEQETTEDIYALGGGVPGVKTIFRLIYSPLPASASSGCLLLTSIRLQARLSRGKRIFWKKLSHWQRLFLCSWALAAMWVLSPW